MLLGYVNLNVTQLYELEYLFGSRAFDLSICIHHTPLCELKRLFGFRVFDLSVSMGNKSMG